MRLHFLYTFISGKNPLNPKIKYGYELDISVKGKIMSNKYAIYT